MTGKLVDAFRLLMSKPKNNNRIESDAVSSPPRSERKSDSSRVPNEQRKKPTSWFKRRNSTNSKSSFLKSEDFDEDGYQSYHDHSVNVIECSQVQIGTRNEINYTFMSPTTMPTDIPNFKGSFPQDGDYDWERESQQMKQPFKKKNQPMSSATSISQLESSEEDSDTIESELSPRIQAALRMLADVVSEDDVLELKDHIGRGWRKVAAALGYSKGQIDQFKEKYQTIDEVMYKLLNDWKRVNLNEATVAMLTGALYDAGEIDAAERLACLRTTFST